LGGGEVGVAAVAVHHLEQALLDGVVAARLQHQRARGLRILVEIEFLRRRQRPGLRPCRQRKHERNEQDECAETAQAGQIHCDFIVAGTPFPGAHGSRWAARVKPESPRAAVPRHTARIRAHACAPHPERGRRTGREPPRCYNPAPFFQHRRALAPATSPRPPVACQTKPAAMTSTAELSSPASAGTGLTRGVVDADYTLEDKFTRTRGRIYL